MNSTFSALLNQTTSTIFQTIQEKSYTDEQIRKALHLSYYFGMVPNKAYNIALLVLWSVLLALHFFLLIYKQWWFSTAFLCCGILEVIGYAGRVVSHYNVYKVHPYVAQMVCLTIAPVFTMGGMYYQMAKLIEIYGHRFSFLSSPTAYSYFFIAFDIVSLAVQAAGGGVAAVAADDHNSARTGTKTFIGGLSLQVATMSIFMMLWVWFCYNVYVKPRMKHSNSKWPSFKVLRTDPTVVDYLYREKYTDLRINPNRWVFQYFPLAFSVAVCCVFARCAYRLAELVNGWSGWIITHENYFIILDGLMMLLATVLMTIFHPGFAFHGRSLSIPITRGRVDPETLMTVSQDSIVSDDDANEEIMRRSSELDDTELSTPSSPIKDEDDKYYDDNSTTPEQEIPFDDDDTPEEKASSAISIPIPGANTSTPRPPSSASPQVTNTTKSKSKNFKSMLKFKKSKN